MVQLAKRTMEKLPDGQRPKTQKTKQAGMDRREKRFKNHPNIYITSNNTQKEISLSDAVFIYYRYYSDGNATYPEIANFFGVTESTIKEILG